MPSWCVGKCRIALPSDGLADRLSVAEHANVGAIERARADAVGGAQLGNMLKGAPLGAVERRCARLCVPMRLRVVDAAGAVRDNGADDAGQARLPASVDVNASADLGICLQAVVTDA